MNETQEHQEFHTTLSQIRLKHVYLGSCSSVQHYLDSRGKKALVKTLKPSSRKSVSLSGGISLVLMKVCGQIVVKSSFTWLSHFIILCTCTCSSNNGGTCVAYSPGSADIITTLPFLQHLFTGLQSQSRAKEDLFKLHLGEKQTAKEEN